MAGATITASAYSAMAEARSALVNAGFKADNPAIAKLDEEMAKHSELAVKSWVADILDFAAALRAKVKLATDASTENYGVAQLNRDLSNYVTILQGIIGKFPGDKH